MIADTATGSLASLDSLVPGPAADQLASSCGPSIAVSCLLATFATLAALACAARIRAVSRTRLTRGTPRGGVREGRGGGVPHSVRRGVRRGVRSTGWTAAAAVAVGMAVWSTQLAGGASCEYSGAALFDVRMTLLSALVVPAATGLGLAIVAADPANARRLLLGGTLSGAGWSGATFMTIAALRTADTVGYDILLAALSVAMHTGTATVLCWVAFHLGDHWRRALVAALLLGAATRGSYYTALAAVRESAGQGQVWTPGVDPFALGLITAAGSTIVLMFIAVAAVGGLIHPRVRAGEVIAWPSAPAHGTRTRTIRGRAAASAPATDVTRVRAIPADRPTQAPSRDGQTFGRGAEAPGQGADTRGRDTAARGREARSRDGRPGWLAVPADLDGATSLPSITAVPSVMRATRGTAESAPAAEPPTTPVLLPSMPAGNALATDVLATEMLTTEMLATDEARRGVVFADLTDEELAYVGRSYHGLADDVELLEPADGEPADHERADGEPEDAEPEDAEPDDHELGHVGRRTPGPGNTGLGNAGLGLVSAGKESAAGRTRAAGRTWASVTPAAPDSGELVAVLVPVASRTSNLPGLAPPAESDRPIYPAVPDQRPAELTPTGAQVNTRTGTRYGIDTSIDPLPPMLAPNSLLWSGPLPVEATPPLSGWATDDALAFPATAPTEAGLAHGQPQLAAADNAALGPDGTGLDGVAPDSDGEDEQDAEVEAATRWAVPALWFPPPPWWFRPTPSGCVDAQRRPDAPDDPGAPTKPLRLVPTRPPY